MAAMSRRRVSVKDLGVVDCQGWLLRRKEGRSLLRSKWKKYWFVLKKSSLYWYTNEVAEKAEGFINLCGFTIEQAKQCRKKHAIRASHQLVVTIVIAAESFTDMNKWISKLSAAAEPCDPVSAEECYSEDSDHDDDEGESLGSEQQTEESENVDAPHPLCESSSLSPTTLTSEKRSRTVSDVVTLKRHRRRRPVSEGGAPLSWVDLPGPHEAGLPPPHVEGEREEELQLEKPPDEMESLYKHLQAASLSLLGQPGQRDFRASFIRRCQNDIMNEKLHLVRILTSTLKAKEAELLAVEEILADPTLTASTYRKWRLSNSALLQEIGQPRQAAGGAEPTPPEQQSG